MSAKIERESIDVNASRFDALILKELMDRIANYQSNNGTLKSEHLLIVIQWLSTYNTIKHENSIISKVVNHLCSESNIKEHGQSQRNEDTFETNSKVITVLDDGLQITIQKSIDIKTIIDPITTANSMGMANGFKDEKIELKIKKRELKSEPIKIESTSNLSFDPSSDINNLQPIIDDNLLVDTANIKKFKTEPKSKDSSYNNLEEIPTISKVNFKTAVVKPTTQSLGSAKRANNKSKKRNQNKIKYPPPFPIVPPHNYHHTWKNVPSAPILNGSVYNTVKDNVTLNWNLKIIKNMAEIKFYELYLCKETEDIPDVSMWLPMGNIKADKLPMACTCEVAPKGFFYYFAMRAVDIHDRRGPFDLTKMFV